MKAKARRFGIFVGVLLFWLGVWMLLSVWGGQELLLPSPVAVAAHLWRLCRTSVFWSNVLASLVRVLLGFLSAAVAGTLLAMLTTRFTLAHHLFSPVLHIVRAAPVASFILLAYFWVRLQLLPSFIAFLMVLPLMWANVCQGIEHTDPSLLEMAKVFRFGRWRTLREVRLPSVLPYFEAACTTGLGFAWKSGVAAEVICSPPFSVGKEMLSAKQYLETAEVFAWTVAVVLLSVCMEMTVKTVIRRRKGGRA